MEGRKCLYLTKPQWKKLQKSAVEPQQLQEAYAHEEEEKRKYYEQLDKLSQELKKKWPEHAEGYLVRVQTRKERLRKKDLAYKKTLEQKLRQKRFDAGKNIAEAKEKIFYDSCYGKQLITAIRASKTIEEQKAQIEFNKFIKEKQKEHDEAVNRKLASFSEDFYKKKNSITQKRKQTEKENAEINKTIEKNNKELKAKAKEEERLDELEAARLEKLRLEAEEHEKDYCKVKALEEMRKAELDRKARLDEKTALEELDDKIANTWAKHYDRVRCGMRSTWNKIITKDKGAESVNYNKCYEMIRKAKEEDERAYQTFIDTGIQRLEKREHDPESVCEDKAGTQSKDEYHKQLTEDYKMALEIKEIMKHRNKCICYAASLFTKSCGNNKKKYIREGVPNKPGSFRLPSNKLSLELAGRKRATPDYTSTAGQHRYFAQRAAAAASECTHTRHVDKVVQDYKKACGLDVITST